jgi:polyribonucleotide nucleotidyltransferase
MNNKTVLRREIQWGGKTLAIEIGKLANQASASATVQYGETVILATAVVSKTMRDGIDYFPLSVDFEERMYAAGKIKGSRFIKREGRPTDEAVLTGRLIDRSIRPLFDERMRNDVQVVLTVLSFDGENDSDIPALVAASLVLSISDIPWAGPIGGIRVGQINGELVINPSYEARLKSDLDLIVAGTTEKVVMIEAGAKEVPEEVFFKAIQFGQKHLKEVTDLIADIQKEIGQPKMDAIKFAKEELALEDEVVAKVKEWSVEQLRSRFLTASHLTKNSRLSMLEDLRGELDQWLIEQQVGKERRQIALDFFESIVEEEVSRAIIEDGMRVDGRALDEVRALSAEVALLPRTHGSGLFSRGETQVLSVVTLGGPGEEQVLDSMEESGKKRYMHHYNFPAYSVGETGRMGSPGRREIGHGALAEKALQPVLPDQAIFPYTIRVVSEVLSSNGSSSMGSTCGSTLALMDAGVPIKSPVAGVAMGIATDAKGNYKILTDLQDLEDGKGGMDFKVAGTAAGITAVQMDTKTLGLTSEIVQETLTRAKDGRLKILSVMTEIIAAPRAELSQFAPRIVTIHINPDRIRDLIGPGGKVINEIIDTCGVTINVEQDGTVVVCSTNAAGLTKAVEWIQNLTKEVAVGEVYEGKVVRIMDFGAFVEILPKQDGLVHISEIAPYRINTVTDLVNIGDSVKVKVIEIDELGRINLSMKQANPPEFYPPPPAMTDSPSGGGYTKPGARPSFGGNGGRGGGGNRSHGNR